ncbi:MAG: hypothetical protein KC657_38070 [Myxococcales bacterium]|nr:hypothetical protein [Myxococcales bacterium]
MSACVCETDAGQEAGIITGPTADAGARDAAVSADGGDASVTPTRGAIHLSWTIRKASGGVGTCADAIGENGVNLAVTPMGAQNGFEKTFSCAAGTGDFPDLAFGQYFAAVAIINGAGLALGSAPVASISLTPTPCDMVVGTDCYKNLDVTITLD